MFSKLKQKVSEVIADKRGFMNDLVQVVAGLAVLIITIVIAMFLGQTFASALPINNTSAFYAFAVIGIVLSYFTMVSFGKICGYVQHVHSDCTDSGLCSGTGVPGCPGSLRSAWSDG